MAWPIGGCRRKTRRGGGARAPTCTPSGSWFSNMTSIFVRMLRTSASIPTRLFPAINGAFMSAHIENCVVCCVRVRPGRPTSSESGSFQCPGPLSTSRIHTCETAPHKSKFLSSVAVQSYCPGSVLCAQRRNKNRKTRVSGNLHRVVCIISPENWLKFSFAWKALLRYQLLSVEFHILGPLTSRSVVVRQELPI